MLAVKGCGEPGGIGDGRTRDCVRLTVVDAATGAPVRGAKARIRDIFGTGNEVPQEATRRREHGTTSRTDRAGLVSLEYVFPVTVRWRGSSVKTTVSVPDWLWLEISADGYENKLVPLSDIVGRSHGRAGLPPPCVRVGIAVKR